MNRMLAHRWVEELSSVYCSDEQKAIDGAEILGRHTGIDIRQVKDLGENDRSSTGFLEPAIFESTADQFFASPEQSVQGWETAIDAQSRIVEAVRKIEREDTATGSIAIISHGAVGTLLYCFLADKAIDRRWDQPGSGGGNYLKLQFEPTMKCDWWQPVD